MKFTDGFWNIRPEVKAHYPAQIYETVADQSSITAFGPTIRIQSRSNTLDGPVITARFSSPLENVLHVELVHFTGGRPRGPHFEIKPNATPNVRIDQDDQVISLTSGQLSVRLQKGADWAYDFFAGDHRITGSPLRGVGLMDTPAGRFMHEQISLGVGECVYGLGERFTSFVKNGQTIELWNEDGGTSSEQAYKNIPFFITNRGYGVFIDHPEQVSLEVASENVERIQFSVAGEKLSYFLIYGATPKEILDRYTQLTGRPALPPAWSFGLWLTTSFTTDYDEKTVTHFIDGMAQRDIPLHVFHFDCFWMKEFHWVDFQWDKRVFPDPTALLARLKARGLRICLWINPYIAQQSAMFEEGMRGGYLVKTAEGDVWQWDRWQAGMALVDFTNPAACRWYGDKLRALIDTGVDTFKTDFGERIPTDVVWFDGSDPQRMHNYYTFLYNQAVFKVLEEKLGLGQATVFARSATAGGQQFPVHWGGDSTASFESMAESLRGGLSLGMCGFGFWSHDIGGFGYTASASVYKRWCAFGLLSSHSRLHGATSYRVPWLFDEEAVDVLRFFTRLKCSLMPYLYAQAVAAHLHGVPMLRAMPLEFPDDPACDTLDRQYMLGSSLLVAPVFSSDGSIDFYLPAGRWTHLLTGKIVEGGRWFRETHDFLSLPVYVRPNTLLAIGANDQRPDYDYSEGTTFHLYALEDGSTISQTLYADGGAALASLNVRRSGSTLTLNVSGSLKTWSLFLHHQFKLKSVAGGSTQLEIQGTRILPDTGVYRLQIKGIEE